MTFLFFFAVEAEVGSGSFDVVAFGFAIWDGEDELAYASFTKIELKTELGAGGQKAVLGSNGLYTIVRFCSYVGGDKAADAEIAKFD